MNASRGCELNKFSTHYWGWLTQSMFMYVNQWCVCMCGFVGISVFFSSVNNLWKDGEWLLVYGCVQKCIFMDVWWNLQTVWKIGAQKKNSESQLSLLNLTIWYLLWNLNKKAQLLLKNKLMPLLDQFYSQIPTECNCSTILVLLILFVGSVFRSGLIGLRSSIKVFKSRLWALL